MNILEYIKKEGILGTIAKGFRKCYSMLNPAYVRICPFKIQKNKVIFMNFMGLGYGYDPKYIAEKLKSNSSLDLVWVIRDKSIIGIPKEFRTVKYKSIKYYYELSTAKVWVDDVRKTKEIRKRNGQYYLQTWHGFFPIKKFEKDALHSLTRAYITGAKNDSSMMDLLISTCEFRTNIYKRNFWYDGEIAKCGCPRMQRLLDRENTKHTVYPKYGIDDDSKLFIYAPTFRNSHSLDVYNINLKKTKEMLENKFGSPFRVLVRLHPGMRGMDVKFYFGNDVIDGSTYEDPEELFAAADVLVSDYSDTMFEASVAGKFVFIYASDIEEYRRERDFYYDYFSLPFPICRDNDEVETMLKNLNIDEYKIKIDEFWERQGLYKGIDSAAYLAEWILDKTKK